MISTVQKPGAKSEGRSITRHQAWQAELAQRGGLLVAWIALAALFSILRPETFFTLDNFQTILSTQTIPLILALGLVAPLATGQYDLSVGGTMGFSMILVGYLNVEAGWPIGWSVCAALGSAVAVGCTNAFFIVRVGVDSIVATLGMGTLLAGTALGVSSLPISGISPTLVDATRPDVAGFQIVLVYGVALTIILWYVLSHTPVGRYLYFVGGSPEAARLSGLRVNTLKAGALIAGSCAFGLAGILQAGLLGGADPTIGPRLLLPAFAAAYLGATAIVPGRFNAWGTFVAVYFLATGVVGLQLLGLSGWIEQVFYGAALVLAVALSKVVGMRRVRARRDGEEM